jgi:hypothetical protein
MKSSRNKFTTCVAVVLFFAISVALIAVFAATRYPNALINFSGIKLVTNGSTTQGFVDITLKNINATGVSFCIKYDPEYVQLSDVSDNSVIQNRTVTGGIAGNIPGATYDLDHKYFEQNLEVFPDGVFRDEPSYGAIGKLMPIIGIADPDSGHLIMNFLPKTNASTVCPYIEDIVEDNKINPTIMAADQDLKLGRISFKIVNPDAFSKLTKDQLKEVIQIDSYSSMLNDSTLGDEGVNIAYTDENGDTKWYSRAQQYIKCEFDIDAELSDVQPSIDTITVSAYDIYKNGTKQDLLDFLNERMSMLTLYYSDNSQVPAVFTWNESSNINDLTWNVKGDTSYTITQSYNETYTISVTVNVTPVSLTGFTVDDENITYFADPNNPDDENFPSSVAQLNLASKAHPVLDTYISNGGVSDVKISEYFLEGASSALTELPSGFGESDATYTFIGHLDHQTEQSLYANYPWLTVSNPLPEIKTTRNVVTAEENMPKTLVVNSTETDINGFLTILVSNSDGTPIPTDTTFKIKMPGGDLINATSMGARYSLTIIDDPTDENYGSAIIVLSPDITLQNEQKLAQLINLGDRSGGSFEIAAKESDKAWGTYTDFVPSPRTNLYERPSTGADYEFDYSTSLSAMFPVKAGTTLPTTITLPVTSDRIATTYSGYDGSVPGELGTFTVESWDDIQGDTRTAGSVVTATGTLANTSYTNYGEVQNDDNVRVTIKYYVVENDGEDSIANIPDAVYDTQQEGYDYDKLQTKTFTITNTGATDIYGLSAVISLSADNNKEAFVLTKEALPLLAAGASTDIDISTKIGLPAGKYVSTVSVMSNNKVLTTFNLTFEVSEQPIYRINITIDDDQADFGSAKTQTETYTSEANKPITVVAEPKEDCEFTGWEIVPNDVTFDDPSNATATFTMPESDVEVKATFKETTGAYLRASELLVKDTNDADQKLNDKDWQEIQFDPVTRKYYVAVPNDTSQVKLWFKLRNEADDGNTTLKLTHEHGENNTDELAVPVKDADDEYYKSVEIDLDESPVVNVIKLDMTRDDEDSPGDTVTRDYTVYVYRKLKSSDLMTFNYGNSPYGLIMRDASITDKDAAKQQFIADDFTFTDGNTPAGADAGVKYTSKAWSGATNYDTDDAALFVINSLPFYDSGYSSLRNSIGETVTTTVTKTITVQQLEETTADLQDGSSDDFVYSSPLTINLPDTGQITQLSSERIRPDKYELVYSFTDYDGATVSIKKPLIILSPLGDVNVDKAADVNDVSRVLNRFSKDLADNLNVQNYSVGGLLFKYRICDANKDGCVNAVDANNIRAQELTPFYKNSVLEGGGA